MKIHFQIYVILKAWKERHDILHLSQSIFLSHFREKEVFFLI